MIAYFAVENFASIREKQQFSFFESIHGSESEDSLRPGRILANGGPGVLPVVGVFGANASGKTNFLCALNTLRYLLIFGTPSHEVKEIQITPYKFDGKSNRRPTSFEIVFAVNNKFYEYHLHILDSKITFEKLLVVANERENLIFERRIENKQTQWNIQLDGISEAPVLADSIKGASLHLKESKLFLRYLLETYNIGELEDLFTSIESVSAPYIYKEKRNGEIFDKYTDDLIASNESTRKLLADFLALFDSGIKGFRVIDKQIFSIHLNDKNEETLLDFDFESQGIKQLKNLTSVILDALAFGKTLMIDELDTHLHPLISTKIVKIFQDRKSNPLNAQLFFSSHDIHLMDHSLMRREQIYIAGRGKDGDSKYISLGSIKGLRKDKKLDKAYLEGDFSGLPVLASDYHFLESVTNFAKIYKNAQV